MGTGYVPRAVVLDPDGGSARIFSQGLRENDTPPEPGAWWRLVPIIVVTASLVAFALTIEQIGLALSGPAAVGIGALVAPGIKVWEALAAAVVLVVMAWAIFILGLGLTIPLWPVW